MSHLWQSVNREWEQEDAEKEINSGGKGDRRNTDRGRQEETRCLFHRKSHLLTKNCIFTAFLIHIRNGIILLCSPFFACLVMNQFHFHARTRRKHWTWNDLWYYNKYKPSIWDVCIVVSLNGPLLQWDKVLNVFLEFCILVNNLFSLPVYSNWKLTTRTRFEESF